MDKANCLKGETIWLWTAEANGCKVQHYARPPEQGGPAELFVRPVVKGRTAGVELIDQARDRVVACHYRNTVWV